MHLNSMRYEMQYILVMLHHAQELHGTDFGNKFSLEVKDYIS